MRVHVLNRLPSLRASIEDNPVARPVNSVGCRDPVRLSRDLIQQSAARSGERG
jgi:hypothetical protein